MGSISAHLTSRHSQMHSINGKLPQASMAVLLTAMILVMGLSKTTGEETFEHNFVKMMNESRWLLHDMKVPRFNKSSVCLSGISTHGLDTFQVPDINLSENKLRLTLTMAHFSVDGYFRYLTPISVLVIFTFQPEGYFRVDMVGTTLKVEAEVTTKIRIDRITHVNVTSTSAKVHAEGVPGKFFAAVTNSISSKALKSAINSEMEQYIIAHEQDIRNYVNSALLLRNRTETLPVDIDIADADNNTL